MLGGSERESGRALGRSLIIECDESHQKITITITNNSFHFHRDKNFWFATTITLPAPWDEIQNSDIKNRKNNRHDASGNPTPNNRLNSKDKRQQREQPKNQEHRPDDHEVILKNR